MSAKNPNPVDQAIGAKIRARRMQMGLSQEKLGEALGITFQQIQKYEKGTNRVSGSRLSAMASTLKVPPAFFFEGIGGDGTVDPDTAALAALTGVQREILDAVASLPVGAQRAILAAAKAIQGAIADAGQQDLAA